jgi:hypothetical protein
VGKWCDRPGWQCSGGGKMNFLNKNHQRSKNFSFGVEYKDVNDIIVLPDNNTRGIETHRRNAINLLKE